MAKRFGPIGTTIWNSDKFWQLSSDRHRLGYLYLIACPHGNPVGVFRLPPAYINADMRVTASEAEEMLADFARVGLIERGSDDQIRIVGWFKNETGASNPSTGSGFCKSFKDTRSIKRGDLRTRAILEMIHATLERAQSWNPETQQYSKLIRDLTDIFLAESKLDQGAVERAAIAIGIEPEDTVWHTVWDTVWHTLGYTKKEKRTGKGKIDSETERDRENERDRECFARAGASRPKPDDDTQAVIAALNKKSKGSQK